MVISLIDTHAHLDMPEFDSDRFGIICRAKEAGVEKIISIGIDLLSSEAAIKLSESNEGIFAAVGIHPHNTKEAYKRDMSKIEKLASHPCVVAIGEIGLDYHYQLVDKQSQIRLLNWQLELAERLKLPIVIHCREAEEDLLPILTDWCAGGKKKDSKSLGVIHCFSGDLEIARKYIEMGFFISLGAYIGYPSARYLHKSIQHIPLDKLLVESDCPFLPPQKYRGRRNEPAFVNFTLQALADIIGNTQKAIAQKTTANANQLFKLEVMD